MSFTYAPGSTTPDYSGLFEIPALSLRICNVPDTGVDPSFHGLVIPPISETCPMRYSVTPIPRGGAKVADAVPDSWKFDVLGWFLLDDVADVQAAIDYLTDRITMANGDLGVSLNAPGWTEPRTMTVRKGDPVQVTVPAKGELAAGYREFLLSFVAADPLKYSTTQTSTPVTTATIVTNAGNAKVPYIARFDGPNTGFAQMAVGIGGDNVVGVTYAIPSGKYIEINTRDSSYVTDIGVDMNAFISVGSDARLLAPGTSSFTKSSGGGSPVATVKHYDGWE